MRFRLDHFANTSPLQKVHPAEKLLFALCCLIAVLTCPEPKVNSGILLAVSLVIMYMGQIPVRFYLKLLMVPAAFIGLSLLGISFELVVTEQGLALEFLGLSLAYPYFIKALAATAAMYFLVLTTPIADLLTVLRGLRVPELLLELMSLTYHFVFVLLEVATEITTSQEARLGYRSPKLALKSLGLLVSQLLVRTLQRASQLQQTLEARGFTGSLAVFTPAVAPSKANLILISLLGLVLISINLIGVG